MSKEQIEKRIRVLFYFLFGVIFSFLFIMSSVYIGFLKDVNDKQRDQIKGFIVEGIKVREKYIYEEFITKNYESIDARTSEFLKKQFIKNHDLVLLDSEKCITGNERLCQTVRQLANLQKNKELQIFSQESLGEFFVVFPVKGWGENYGYYSLVIPVSEISEEQTFFKTLVFYVGPFLLLFFLSLSVYRLTEKMIIKPTIKRIIESEKIQTQRDMVKQFAHDIRSPIVTLETVLDVYSDEFPKGSRELIAKALERISGISDDLLSCEKKIKHTIDDIHEFLLSIQIDKKLEFKNKKINFQIDCNEKISSLTVNKIELYRVLSNLINNSIEASDKKEVMISITVKFKNDWILISVSDNAGGISVDKIPLIIEGDFTTKENGNGLGVSGARKWLRNIGGEIKMSSQFGIGTTVDLYVPIEFSV